MKPLFGGLVLIFIFFVIEMETAGTLKKIKTKHIHTAGELDDQARRDDHRTTLIIGTPVRPKNLRAPRQKPRAARGDRAGFELECEIDQTGEKAQKMFLEHYREKGLPNAPDITLTLYNERHTSGSYRLNEEQVGHLAHRYKKVREFTNGPFIQQHHQQMYQQHQALQDHPGGSGSSSKGPTAYNRYPNVYEVGDQSDRSGLGSGNNHPYTTPPMTPSVDLNTHFNIQPPEHPNFQKNSSQNNPSATTLIDNYNIHLRRKYGDDSKGSGY